jgi:hypothetical protein
MKWLAAVAASQKVINKNIRFSFQDGGVCLHFVGYDAVLIPSPWIIDWLIGKLFIRYR